MPRAVSKPIPPPIDEPRIARRELILIAVIVAVGLVLRAALPGRMSVEHYDEGVYASNLAVAKTNPNAARYPFQHLYAPPLLPALIECSMLLFGQRSISALLVSIVAGALTPLLLWYSARKWFGAAAGISAATLAALSDFHMLYSRAALTDVLLCFWFLIAVHCTWEAFRKGRLAWAFAAGIATSLAWWTKYSGWLPLAVGISGVVPWLLFHREARPAAARSILLWIAIAAVAIVIWSPWWIELKQYGGYAVVSDNHSRYLVGLNNWWPTFLHQVANHRHYNGWLSCVSLLLAGPIAVSAGSTAAGFTGNGTMSPIRFGRLTGAKSIAVSLVLAALGIASGSSLSLALGAVAGMALQILPRLRSPNCSAKESAAALAAWLIAAWFFGTLISTPTYHPYPRLTLPCLVAAWLGTASAIGAIVDHARTITTAGDASATPAGSIGHLGIAAGLLLLVGSVVFKGSEVLARGVPAWQDRTDLERTTLNMVERAREFARSELKNDSPELLMYVYGEPGVFFHSGRNEGILGVPVAELNFADPNAQRPSVPTFLVAAPPAARSELFAAQWTRYRERFREVGVFRYSPSDLVLNDEHHPDAIARMIPRLQEEIRLYHMK